MEQTADVVSEYWAAGCRDEDAEARPSVAGWASRQELNPRTLAGCMYVRGRYTRYVLFWASSPGNPVVLAGGSHHSFLFSLCPFDLVITQL